MSDFTIDAVPPALDVGAASGRVSRVRSLFAALRAPAGLRIAPLTLDVPAGRLRYVREPRGRVVTCLSGSIWLTFDGEALDVVLHAGCSYRCKTNSRLGISAFEHASVQLA